MDKDSQLKESKSCPPGYISSTWLDITNNLGMDQWHHEVRHPLELIHVEQDELALNDQSHKQV